MQETSRKEEIKKEINIRQMKRKCIWHRNGWRIFFFFSLATFPAEISSRFHTFSFISAELPYKGKGAMQEKYDQIIKRYINRKELEIKILWVNISKLVSCKVLNPAVKCEYSN